jgi:hypothetical protein
MDNSRRQPWDRRKEEPGEWFERFTQYYLPLGPTRSLLAAYRIYGEERGLTKKIAAPKNWRDAFKQWKWEDRADLWDESELKKFRVKMTYELRKARERHLNYGRLLQAKALEKLKELVKDELDAELAVRLLEKGITLELHALGQVDLEKGESSEASHPQIVYYIPNNGRDTPANPAPPDGSGDGGSDVETTPPPTPDLEPPPVAGE